MRPTAALFLVLMCAALPAAAQTGSIAGTVIDARDGTPLEKVSVRVLGTTLATVTTSEGRFQLDGVPADTTVLLVAARK